MPLISLSKDELTVLVNLLNKESRALAEAIKGGDDNPQRLSREMQQVDALYKRLSNRQGQKSYP
jgi:K+/H+ antiporter YhaU regulatory subunit KhtT